VRNGVFTHYFEQLCGFVSGLDNSSNVLAERACWRVVEGELTYLPFGDRSFDVVFEANLLHHVEDRTEVVREMARVSRRWVILIEPNRYNPLMLAFGLAVPAERVFDFDQDVESCDLAGDWVQAISCVTTGMISQNNTPSVFLPLLKRFDREIWYRDYVVLVAEKPP